MHQPNHCHQHQESAIFPVIQMKVGLPQNWTILSGRESLQSKRMSSESLNKIWIASGKNGSYSRIWTHQRNLCLHYHLHRQLQSIRGQLRPNQKRQLWPIGLKEGNVWLNRTKKKLTKSQMRPKLTQIENDEEEREIKSVKVPSMSQRQHLTKH